jgi:hypothetical protein
VVAVDIEVLLVEAEMSLLLRHCKVMVVDIQDQENKVLVAAAVLVAQDLQVDQVLVSIQVAMVALE